MARDIVLGVKRVFDGHGTGDAAGVDVAVHRAAVTAERYLTERDGVDIDTRGVDDQIARAASERGDGGEHRVRELVELAADVADIGGKSRAGVFDVFGDQRELAVRRGDRADDHVDVRHGDDVGDVKILIEADVDIRQGGILRIEVIGVKITVDTDARLGDGVGVDVDGHVVRRVRCIGEVARDQVKTVGNFARAVFGVVDGLFDERVELLDLRLDARELAGGDLRAHIGLHLAGDAADVLSPADRAFIAAREHLSAAAADHAANIVADVLITDGGVVCARCDRAGGIARDAAGVGGDIERVESGQTCKVKREIEAQVAQVNAGVGAFDIHIRAAAAGDDGAEVLAHDAAGHALAEDRARGVARAHDARGEVAARDAADAAFAGNTSVECAAFDRAVVFTHDAADIFAVAGRGDRALNIQVFDDGVLLQHAEKTGGGDALRDGKAADGVAVAVERAAERRDGELVIVGQLDIVVKHNGFTARPGVERAGMREGS